MIDASFVHTQLQGCHVPCADRDREGAAASLRVHDLQGYVAQCLRSFASRFAAQHAPHLTDVQVQQVVLVELLQLQPYVDLTAARGPTPPVAPVSSTGGQAAAAAAARAPLPSGTPATTEPGTFQLSFRHDCS